MSYMSLPRFSECKRLAYEVVTIYKQENPTLMEDYIFPDKVSHERYHKWLLMNHPDLHRQWSNSKGEIILVEQSTTCSTLEI